MRRRKPLYLSARTLYLLVFLVLLMAFLVLMERNLSATILAIARMKADNIATTALTDAIESVAQDVDYRDLILIEKDAAGRVVMMQPDTGKIMSLAARATAAIQDQLVMLTERTIPIPLGLILGSRVFANVGPSIPLTLVPLGRVDTNIVQSFEQAGINQTLHVIILQVETAVQIIVPFFNEEVVVRAQYPLAQALIAGEVPHTYFNWEWGQGPTGNGPNAPGQGLWEWRPYGSGIDGIREFRGQGD